MEIPRLHPDTIEQVKQRVDIVDVVSEHVVLRKQGKDFVGLCPFHDDKSPSFSVSPGKQFYYCFSCGAGGNAFKFLMELGKRSFSDVVLELARRYQVPVETLKPEERQAFQRQLTLREKLYEILALTARFYEHALNQAAGQAALDYVTAQRGLPTATIQQFQLGYAPGGWSTLYGYLVEQKQYPVELVERAGLIVPRKGGGGYYDRFRDRLMIPIHDLYGRVVGFGGRSLGDEQPKYLNSPETELFDKGRILFGLDKARGAIAKLDQAVVVEGYFDVIALHQAGITQTVASMGTALSTNQVKQLLRYTESKRIILNFDADTAGGKATIRGIDELFLYLSKMDEQVKYERLRTKKGPVPADKPSVAHLGAIDLRIVEIPGNKDSDEFLKFHTAEDYQKLLDNAPTWMEWKIEGIFRDKKLDHPEQFQRCSYEVVQLLGSISDPVLRNYYLRHCAERLAQNNSYLSLQIQISLQTQVQGERWHGRSQKWQTSRDRTLLEQAEAQLIRLYIHKAHHRDEIETALDDRDLEFSLSHHRILWRQIMDLKEQDGIDLADASIDLLRLLEETAATDTILGHVYGLFQLDEINQLDTYRGRLVIQAAIAAMEKNICEKRRRHFLDLLKSVDWAADPDSARSYQQKIQVEDERLRQLEAERQVDFADLVSVPFFAP